MKGCSETNFIRATQAVANLSQGYSADARMPLEFAVPFTSDYKAQQAAAHQIGTVLESLSQDLNDQQLTILTSKVLAYFVRNNFQTPSDILYRLNMDELAHRLNKRPIIISADICIERIMGRQPPILPSTNDPAPPRTILWHGEGAYRLTEAQHPTHLVEDTKTLGHCVGRMPDDSIARGLGYAPDDPDFLRYLHFWQRIERGKSRIFSLMEDDIPAVTIEYEIRPQRITDIMGKGYIYDNSRHFIPLCGALGHLKSTTALSYISRLPFPPDKHVLTPGGKFEPITPENEATALAINDGNRSFIEHLWGIAPRRGR